MFSRHSIDDIDDLIEEELEKAFKACIPDEIIEKVEDEVNEKIEGTKKADKKSDLEENKGKVERSWSWRITILSFSS